MAETGLSETPEINSKDFWVMEYMFNERIKDKITFDFFLLYDILYKNKENNAFENILIDGKKLDIWFENRKQEIIDFTREELNSFKEPIKVFCEDKSEIKE